MTKLIKKIAIELNQYKIPYMIIGGQAALLYREPRFTNGIDITLMTDIQLLSDILNICCKLDLQALTNNPEAFVADTMVLPTLNKKSGLKIDFIFSNTNFEIDALYRVNKIILDSIEICYCSLEDLIIYKTVSGRERDLEDIRNIIIKNPEYNSELIVRYLKEFTETLNIDYLKRFEMILHSLK